MRIRSRIFYGQLALVLVFAVNGLFALYAYRSISRNTEMIRHNVLEDEAAIAELDKLIADVQNRLKSYFLSNALVDRDAAQVSYGCGSFRPKFPASRSPCNSRGIISLAVKA